MERKIFTLNDVVDLYLNEVESLNNLSKKYGFTQESIIEELHNREYFYAKKGARASTVKKVKEAAMKYIELGGYPNTNTTKIGKEFKIAPKILVEYIKQYYPDVRIYRVAFFNECIFDTIDTEEKAYWLGFIYADGTISSSPLSESKNKNYEFELSLGLKDVEHLKKFARFIGWEDHVSIDSFRCRFSVNSKHLWNVLNNYGCTPQKSLTLKFPIIESFNDLSLIRHFIRGYWDGDGCLSYTDSEHTNPNISVIGTSNFLMGIQKYLPLNKEYKLNIQHLESQNITKNFQIGGREAIRIAEYLYGNSNIYLNRKYEKYLEYCRLLEESDK